MPLSGNPSLESTPNAAGIGRALTPASLEAIAVAFDRYTPDSIELKPQKTPGVNYVNWEEITGLIERRDAQIDPSRLPPLVDRVVASLCDDTKRLNPAIATKAVGMQIDRIRFTKHTHNLATLMLRIYDFRDKFYPSGYLMEGERSVVRQTFRQEPVVSARGPGKQPRRLLTVGLVHGDLREIEPTAVYDIKRSCKSVELQRVGVITPI